MMDDVIFQNTAATNRFRRIAVAIGSVFGNQLTRFVSEPTRAFFFTALVVSPLLAKANGAEPVAVEYDRDIRPILAEHCYACHGPDEKHREADLRLDVGLGTHQSSAIVPGKPDQSAVVTRLLESDDALRMPPAKTGKRLSSKQIELIRKWIAEGATYTTHWAFAPLRHIELPKLAAGIATEALDEIGRAHV